MSAVLNVITGLGAGGAETMLVQLATAAHARGIPQHVVSLGGRGRYADVLEKSGVGVTALDIASVTEVPGALARLAGLINRLSPKVIHGWMYHGNIMAALAHRLARRGRPRTLLWNLRASNMDDKRYRTILRWSAWLSSWPDLVIANSESGAAFHSARGYRPRHLIVIYNGVDTEKFHPDPALRAAERGRLGIPADATVAIHVARVDPMKDHASFLAAMAALPDVVGLVVGAGTNHLTTPPNVRRLGFYADMADLYPVADIVVSSSAFGEGFSNAVAEGMSAGLIPVATDVGDTMRIIGDTGHLVPARNVAVLTEAMAAVATLPPLERAQQGEHARERILANFTFTRALDAFTELYQTFEGPHKRGD